MLGAESVRVPEWRGGRDPAEVFALTSAAVVDVERRAMSQVTAEAQWNGALPTPSPSVVYDDPLLVLVCDADGNDVTVSGTISTRALVVVREHGQWWVVARFG